MAEEKSPEQVLLEKIKAETNTTLETRGYVNKAAVDAELDARLKGMNLDALRAYDENKTAQEETNRKLAAKLEKLEQRHMGPPNDKPDTLRSLLENSKEDIEKRFNNPNDKVSEVRLNVRAAAIMSLTNTVDNTTNTVPIAMIDSMSMDAFAKKRRGIQFINDIADRNVVQNITQYKTWLEEGTEQGAFAIVAEGGLKPLVSDGVVRNYAKAKKIAGKYVVTEEFAKFFANIYTIVRGLIVDKLIRDYSAILVTDLNTLAATYTGSNLDATIAAPNDYDAVGAVANQIMQLNFVPDVLIVNPADLWRIRLTKDTQGRYLFPVQNSTGGIDMFGFDVIVSTYQTVGSFTLGESGLFKIEEEPVTIRMGYGIDVTTAAQTAANAAPTVVTAVSSDLDNNRMRVIVETYFNDWIPTPYIGSYVKASFATVKTALHS